MYVQTSNKVKLFRLEQMPEKERELEIASGMPLAAPMFNSKTAGFYYYPKIGSYVVHDVLNAKEIKRYDKALDALNEAKRIKEKLINKYK